MSLNLFFIHITILEHLESLESLDCLNFFKCLDLSWEMELQRQKFSRVLKKNSRENHLLKLLKLLISLETHFQAF